MVKIFTETLADIRFRNVDSSNMPGMDEPFIWLIHTDSYSAPEISSFEKLLSVQEQEKAARFKFLRDRNSYIVTHALLRIILGNHLGSEPAEIEFISNDFGKPSLAGKCKKIHFNLSHSSECSVLAFSIKSEIGVDIEKIDPGFDFDLIAKAHFSETENSFIDAERDESRKRFYTVWTRKEALLKAIGTGIGGNLDVEVFRKVNQYNLDFPFPIIQETDYYLNTFEYQDKYMITTAGKHPELFNSYKYKTRYKNSNPVHLLRSILLF